MDPLVGFAKCLFLTFLKSLVVWHLLARAACQVQGAQGVLGCAT